MSESPSILRRQVLIQNPWVTLVQKDLSHHGRCEDYYSLLLPDYVAIVATDPQGRVALVRQYRPAVEEFTLELPAGTLEPGEEPEVCARRELLEETGLRATSMRKVGSYRTDTGRLENWQHIFHAVCETPDASFVGEEGVEVSYADLDELQTMIADGRFNHLLHVSSVYLAGVLPRQ